MHDNHQQQTNDHVKTINTEPSAVPLYDHNANSVYNLQQAGGGYGYQPPMMQFQQVQPVVAQVPVHHEIKSTNFQNHFKQVTPTQHELTLLNQQDFLKYLCCASFGLCRIGSYMNQVSHITIIPPSPDFNVLQSSHEVGNRVLIIPPPIPSSSSSPENGCCNGCCDGCCNGCCNGCCSGKSKGGCCNCGDCKGGCCDCNCDCDCGNGDGALLLIVIVLIILLLCLVFLIGLYAISAPIAIFLIVYYEKITTIEFNDEKREIQMTSKARYLRDYFIFAKHSILYDQIHNIYPQMLKSGKDEDYCLIIQTRDGQRVNISKPLSLNYDDLMSGALFLKQFFRERGVTFIGDSNITTTNMMMTPSTSTSSSYMPMNHQMV